MDTRSPVAPGQRRCAGTRQVFVHEKVMPGPVAGDAVHVTVATIHRMDYVLTWNVIRLANPSIVAHLSTMCVRSGLLPPKIVTPELLWEEEE